MSAKEFGVLLALGAIWGASFMFIKVGGEELSPFALVEMRLGLAAITLLLLGTWRGAARTVVRAYWKPLTIMGLLNCALPYSLLTWGEVYISSGLAAIYNATAPLWAAALGMVWVSAERLSLGRMLGVFLGLLGVVLVVSGNLSGGEEGIMHLLGQGAVLLMALSYAVAGIYARKSLQGVSPRIAATGQLVTGSLMLLPLAAFQVPDKMPSWLALGAVATLSIVGTAFASLMYYWLLATVGATKALLVTYLLPGFALVWGAIFLREAVTPIAILGLLLVLLGITITSGTGLNLLMRLRRRPGKAPA